MTDATKTVKVQQDVAASPERVWALISDVTRMGEWSPENTGGTWSGGADGPEVGARFKGKNKNGKKSWSTSCKVVDAEPGRTFAFKVSYAGASVASWRYDIEPKGEGCLVTETWTDDRGMLAKVFGKPISGVDDRSEHNRSTMEETLRNLGAAAEAGA